MPPPDGNQRNNSSTIKNNNPDWHWLRAGNICKICRSGVASLTLHYVNEYPNSEVISSRIAPELAALLRNPKYAPKCEVVNRPPSKNRHYKQICFFCNEPKIYTKSEWINHMIRHTGYYKKQCDGCSKKFSKDLRYNHDCDGTIKSIRQPQFDEMDIIAYVCNLCNFVRFDEKEIRKHLRNEHQANYQGVEEYEEIVFLTFPNHSLSRQINCKTPTLDLALDDEDRMELRKKSNTVDGRETSNGTT